MHNTSCTRIATSDINTVPELGSFDGVNEHRLVDIVSATSLMAAERIRSFALHEEPNYVTPYPTAGVPLVPAWLTWYSCPDSGSTE